MDYANFNVTDLYNSVYQLWCKSFLCPVRAVLNVLLVRLIRGYIVSYQTKMFNSLHCLTTAKLHNLLGRSSLFILHIDYIP